LKTHTRDSGLQVAGHRQVHRTDGETPTRVLLRLANDRYTLGSGHSSDIV